MLADIMCNNLVFLDAQIVEAIPFILKKNAYYCNNYACSSIII